MTFTHEQRTTRKQIGAYYTEEDVSEYVARNTIIPFLFAAAKEKCPDAFRADGLVWQLLPENPDRYIYEAVRREDYLPTETEREYTTRRKRYTEIKARLVSGGVTSINDCITYNLDIRQFAQDAIEHCEEPGLLRALYNSLEQMTILDPTCGSGAFLLAALDVLVQLYKACLERMENWQNTPSRHPSGHPQGVPLPYTEQPAQPSYGRGGACPRPGGSWGAANRPYEITRAIILNNLYGVDIMEGAVEMCKQHLFSKLIAQDEGVEDVEPLPNIDRNIRVGNALIEFDWYIEFSEIMQSGGFDVIIGNPPYVEYSTVKQEYTLPPGVYKTEVCGNLYAFCMERFATLGNTASVWGLVVPLSIVCTQRMAPVREVLYSTYSNLWLSNYDTIPGTLFAGIVQRNTIVLGTKCNRERGCRVYTTKNQKWYAAERTLLFESVPYINIETRSADELMPKVSTQLELDILKKVDAQGVAMRSYFQAELAPARVEITPSYRVVTTFLAENRMVYKRRWSYFLLFADEIMGIVLPDGSMRQQRDVKVLAFQPQFDRYVFIALLNSGLFYFHYSVFADFRHVNRSDFDRFSFDYRKLTKVKVVQLSQLGKKLMQGYAENIAWRRCNYVGSIGECLVPFYRQGASKAILDEIDGVLAGHYGLTEEELDFIVHYDIKYRVGEEHAI